VPDRDPARRKRFGAALAGTAKLGERLTVMADYYHLTVRDRQDLGQAIANVALGGQPFADIPAYAQDQDFQNARVDVLTGKLRYELAPGIMIENAARYGSIGNGYLNTSVSRFNRGANDPVAPGGVDYRINTSRAGWQGIRFFADRLNLLGTFTTGGLAHSLAAGLEYTTYTVKNRFGQLSAIPGAAVDTTATSGYAYAIGGAANCINGSGTALNAYCLTDGLGTLLDNRSTLLGRTGITRSTLPATIWKVETIGGYAMDSIDVAPWLTISGGVRFDAFDYHLLTNNLITGAQTADFSYDDVLWGYNLGASVKPAANGMVYLAWATGADINGGESDTGTNCGYGGLCSATVDGAVAYRAKPERSDNFELGTKWEFFSNRLLATASLFQTVKKDVMEGINGDSYTLNGGLNSGKIRVRGVELALAGNITDDLSGQVVASFARSKVLESLNPGLSTAQLEAGATNVGKRLANFADNGVDALLKYQVGSRIAVGGNVTYKSAMYGGQPDTAAAYVTTLGSPVFGQYSIRVPGYTTFGAFISYKINDHLTARINALNLTDKTYYVAAYRSGSFAYLGDGRTVRFTLSGKF
jgi:catecholate siderophore receptor